MSLARKIHLFQNMNATSWQNLGMVALLSLYTVLFIQPILNSQILASLGSDYRAFWAAGYIANHWSYADIYDLKRISEVQISLTPQIEPSEFYPIPAPYLPIFLIPFQVMSLLSPKVSFWLWEIINMIGMVAYLSFFIRRYNSSIPRVRLIILVLMLMPVFNNFWWGQPGLWLLICAGEFFCATRNQEFFKAGAWLAGFMFKPQLLILILPALVLQRAWKTLIGFTASAGMVGIISLAMLGIRGVQNYLSLLSLWGETSNDLRAINPFLMINWRMFGLHLGGFFSPTIGLVIAIIGTLITIFVSLWLWRKPFETSETIFVVAMFGIFAATCASAWHSHQHSLMIAIPPFLLLLVENKIPNKMLNLWLFLLPASWVMSLLIGILMGLGIIPLIGAIGGFISGTAGLFLSLYTLSWATTKIKNG